MHFRECDQQTKLMVISDDTANAFTSARKAAGKPTGLQLGHFAVFYKASWRANDWMFGRLDGAWRLAQAVLSPARLYQIYHGNRSDAWEEIHLIATSDATQDVTEYLREPRD